MKNAIIAIVVVVVIAGGYFLFRKQPTPKTPSVPSQNAQKVAPTENQNSASSESPASAPNQSNVVLKTDSNAALGVFLVAPNGMTLYKYTKDTAGVTNCYDQCAVNWPPYIVSAATALKAESSVKGAITTVKRTDGTMQVAYNGMPLYYWINDKAPGDTTGQNVGGVWFVVSP